MDKAKRSLWLKLLTCFTLAVMLLGVIFSLPNLGKKEIDAKAETDITDTLTLGDWGAPETESDIRYLWFNDYGGLPTSLYKEWWNDNGTTNAASNNGIDIMEYIYIDGESTRSIVTQNQQGTTSYKASSTSPLSYGGVFAPVAVFTTGSGCGMKVMLDYKTSFVLTVKAGFQITTTDGTTYTVSEDVDFQIKAPGSGWSKIERYTVTFNDEDGNTVETKRITSGEAIGELPEVPAKDGYVGFWTIGGAAINESTVITAAGTATPVYALEYQDLLGLSDITSSWGTSGDQYVFQGIHITDGSAFNTNSGENDVWDVFSLAEANLGCDIMEYIYVENESTQGKSSRTLVNENVVSEEYVGTSGWLTRADCCPVFVQTTSNTGMIIRIVKEFAGDSFTITFKKGFTIQLVDDGDRIYLSDDIKFTYANGTLTRETKYTLTFDGVESRRIVAGATIGELPEIPAKDGCEGVWTVDGEEITADTAYNYGANKTATIVYSKDITETIGFGDWGIPESESDIRYLQILDGGAQIENSYSNEYWNDHADMKDENYGVDIMEYVLIDGESVRSIINENSAGTTSYKGTVTTPLTWGGCFAPVVIMMNGSTAAGCIKMKVLTDYKTSFEVTFKAGFTVINTDGVKLYTSEDVTYAIGETTGDITKVTAYTLSFEGLTDTITLEKGDTIGELPEVPEKDGCIAVGWAIDGVEISADTVYNYDSSKTATPIYWQQYKLSFDGLSDTVTVTENMEIGTLPDVPANSDYDGVWTIDGEEITANTVYTYGADKTADAAYSKDITKYIALEDRTSWGACSAGGEFYFGVLDMRDANGVTSNSSTTYYLNSSIYSNENNSLLGTWYVGNTEAIADNNGVDIMEYIYLNDTSARELITANANGAQLKNDCNGDGSYGSGDCWLSNAVASPVYVETTNGSGIMVKILQEYSGDYFEITLKSGFSLINSDGATVYLTDDVTYKYINYSDAPMFAKGEITDEDLDKLNGQDVVLKNGDETYLTKTTCRLTLPEIDPVIVGEDGLSQVFVGWTTDTSFGDGYKLYPAGYKLDLTEATTLYAVWIGFEMQDGAAVRTATDSNGIRFLVDIDKSGYQIGLEKSLISEVGTFVVPTDYLKYVDAFTRDNFDEGQYIEKVTKTWRVEGDNATWTYAAAFVNISQAQYARSMSARGYLKINFTSGEGYIYTPYVEENNARSIYDVALQAYDDEEYPQYKTNAAVLEYINSVANLTWSAEDYSFAKTSDVAGDYVITSVSLDGNTVTVTVDGDVRVSSALVNGKRLAASGNSSNVQIGNYIFSVSGFEIVDGGFRFTFGAAANDYDKQSDETLYFESSEEDLDFFLNDYFKRHSGYVEDGVNLKVNSVTAGVNSEEFFSQEWMSRSYYWFNSFDGYTNAEGINEDRIAGLRKFLSSVPVDDYGYVWSSNDRVRDAYSDVSTGEQKMGWPFPDNNTVGTMHWEFNGSDSGSRSSNVSASLSGGLYSANVSGQSSNITFTLTAPSYTKKIYTQYAPLLEFEVRIDDATNVEDIYVWYTTSSSTSFSDDKKVSVNEKAFIKYDYSGEYQHVLYLPMYAESAWGESTSTYVKQIKIEIALKSGTTISGNVGLNYVRPTLDTRMSNNNSILISSLRTDYDYTGDLDYLAENITRARKAMNFLMQMYDSTRGLKKESYLVGHGGTKEDLNWLGNATTDSIADSISQGYWDIMYMPEYDFQSNTYFYKAARDMAYLEGVLSENNIEVDTSLATVKTATRDKKHDTCAYSYDLESVANTVLTNLRQTTEDTNHTGFWDATDGRFVAGYASGESRWYDYGYVAWNLEAIYYGIATEEQAASIMNWLESESSLYEYVFAPISNTVTGDPDMLNGEYAAKDSDWVNCQYGGAIMYTSFYDLMARIDTLGADNAFERLTAIQNWYKEVYDYYVANGSDPYDFYRYYYDNKGIQCQGMGTQGAVGLDREFLESFLPVSAVAYGFFGIESVDGKTLQIAPELPTDLTYWSMENLAFNKVKYDLTIYANGLQLTNVRAGDVDTTGLKLQIALDYTDGQTVYVNGVATTPDKTENGKAYVTIAFGAAIVEVR